MTKSFSGLAAMALFVAACSTGDRSSSLSAGGASATANGDVALAPAAEPAYRLVVEQPGNEARYRVRERLAGHELDNDAVGVTQAITGQLAFNADGTIIPESSILTIDVTPLKSDQQRRDGYVQNRLLETAKYPTVVFKPTAVRGAPKTLPTSGTTAFSLIGDLTVKGVTKPTTWFISAKFAPDAVTGSASTGFTFTDFSIAQPKVPILLSVADTIKLEYDFRLAVKK